MAITVKITYDQPEEMKFAALIAEAVKKVGIPTFSTMIQKWESEFSYECIRTHPKPKEE